MAKAPVCVMQQQCLDKSRTVENQSGETKKGAINNDQVDGKITKAELQY